MLSKVYGPVATIRTALARLGGVREAYIFGSFAERWQGVPGPVPNDVDVLVVGELEVDAIWSAAAEASRELGVEVNPVIRTPEEWEGEHTGFADAVRNGPRIVVLPAEFDHGAGSPT